MNETLKTIKARRSVRAYTAQQVSEGDLNTILEAATLAPSGMNYQNWHITAVQNEEVLAEINRLIKQAFGKSDNPLWLERSQSDSYCCYYHAPTLIVVSGKADDVLAQNDCACALQNIFLAATSLGLSSCWINQLGQTCNDADVRAYLTAKLEIPADYAVYGCAAVGYAPVGNMLKVRKMKEGVLTIVK